MSAPIKGVDVSGWQHPDGARIDWLKVRKAGYRFAVIKCTQGLDYVNEYFRDDALDAEAAGLVVGAYHFAEPSPESGGAQAEFAATVCMGLRLALGIAIDLEQLGTLQFYELDAWCKQFASVINGKGLHCPVYSGGDFGRAAVGYPFGHRAWWVADSGELPANVHPYMTQGPAEAVDGIEGDVDTDLLLWPRAINPPPLHRPALPPQDAPEGAGAPDSAPAAESAPESATAPPEATPEHSAPATPTPHPSAPAAPEG